MKDGKIEERGNHDTLIAMDGYYVQLLHKMHADH